MLQDSRQLESNDRGEMRPKILRLLSALLAGQRYTLPSGHILVADDEGHVGFLMTRTSPGQEPEEVVLGCDWPINTIIDLAEEIPDDELARLSADTVLTEINTGGGPSYLHMRKGRRS